MCVCVYIGLSTDNRCLAFVRWVKLNLEKIASIIRFSCERLKEQVSTQAFFSCSELMMPSRERWMISHACLKATVSKTYNGNICLGLLCSLEMASSAQRTFKPPPRPLWQTSCPRVPIQSTYAAQPPPHRPILPTISSNPFSTAPVPHPHPLSPNRGVTSDPFQSPPPHPHPHQITSRSHPPRSRGRRGRYRFHRQSYWGNLWKTR